MSASTILLYKLEVEYSPNSQILHEASRFLFQSGKYYIQLSRHYVSHKNRKFRYVCMYLLIRKGQIAQKYHIGVSHIESTSHRPLHNTNTALIQPLQLPNLAGSTHYTPQCTHMHTYVPHINIHAHTHCISTSRQTWPLFFKRLWA